MNLPDRTAIDGVVVDRDPTYLPTGMIESTTEYDYPDLPDYLRADLEAWCERFRAWDRAKRVEERR